MAHRPLLIPWLTTMTVGLLVTVASVNLGPALDLDLVEPVHTYPHIDKAGSITIGVVVDQQHLPSLDGKLVFADFVLGHISSLDTITHEATLHRNTAEDGPYLMVAGFAQNTTDLILVDRTLGPLRAQEDDGVLSFVDANLDLPRSPRAPIAAAPMHDDRWCLVEQAGSVLCEGIGVLIDLGTEVARSDWEQGLLGLAFDLNFSENGRFFLSWTENGTDDVLVTSHVAMHDDNGTLNGTDRTRDIVLLRVPQHSQRHNGGHLEVDEQGRLLASFGDGTDVADRFGEASDPSTLMGTIVRILPTEEGYEIPPDNPHSDGLSGHPAVLAHGFRNPWTFTIDASGNIWVGDVGAAEVEEISILVPGGHHGWAYFEGDRCQQHPSPTYANHRCSGFDAQGTRDWFESRVLTAPVVLIPIVVMTLLALLIRTPNQGGKTQGSPEAHPGYDGDANRARHDG